MPDPAIQRFFGTLLIEATLDDPAADQDTAIARMVALAEAHTGDASAPAQPRFRWAAHAEMLELSAGTARPLSAAPGGFWTAHLFRGPADATGTVLIEDPRIATLGAVTSGLAFREPGSQPMPVIHKAGVRAGGLVMVPAYVRCSIEARDSDRAQHWLVVKLTPQRV